MDLKPGDVERPGPAIHACTAGSGLTWLRSGWNLFLRQPLLIVILVALGPMVLLTIEVIPYFGSALGMMAMPALLIGMLNVCRAVDAGELPSLRNYASALRDAPVRVQLLKIGVFCAIALAIVVVLMSLLFPDSGATGTPAASAPSASTPAGAPADSTYSRADSKSPGAVAGLDADKDSSKESANGQPGGGEMAPTLIVLALGIPLQMALWFSPALVAWHRMPAEKAMFFSFFASWRNRWAILVFLLAYLSLAVLAMLAVEFVKSAMGWSDAATLYLVAPVSLTLLALYQTSNLAMLLDIIDDGSRDEPPHNVDLKGN